MDLENLKEYCLNKKGVWIDFPFDEENMVFKVGSKMFALTNINSERFWVNLKCDPFLSEKLREEYKGIIPGYHMNKKHWNTVYINEDVPDEKIKWLIDISYDLVFKSLKKSEKDEIKGS
ncbi:MmcQ/YjbR family DNA-binding protein [Marinitoga sp. 38H-ov]|uniref:MmcQ/YjbR family DNA-binding protein n=1 Tax=Marinitoga sp. 38H-ov TaxID=1755814 RepID=UPI0013ECD01D|nr:MmcQ/YjbR family DNA-binding protein [Marinitoga sp. 38H-ov]KAF2956331.1 MmcQ-like protein [Marinitoga sp. 38H-ov]